MLWSATSRSSDYVLDEAGHGRDRNCLVPVFVDAVRPPLGFGQRHSINLIDWKGAPDHAEFIHLVESIAAHVPRRALSNKQKVVIEGPPVRVGLKRPGVEPPFTPKSSARSFRKGTWFPAG